MPGAYVVCEAGRIAEVRMDPPAGAPVIEGRYIAPGYIDLHVHGGCNADYMDGTVDAVRIANRAHARHGTTTIFPTTTTGSTAEIAAMLDACGSVRNAWTPADGARIGGVHYYGPYFAEDKVGCHSKEGRRDPDASEYEAFLAAGLIRVATCAAELPGAEAFYRAARAHHCLVTCGHSNSTWTEMARAYEAGMRHVDHFWCAMSSVPTVRNRLGTPMQGSMEQFVLARPEMSTEVIADGCHLAPELLDFAYLMKGAARLCLVTDSNRALDMPPGRYRFGPEQSGTWFESDAKVGFVPGQGLASSVMGMDHMVRTMAASTSAPLFDVIRMAALTPAERVGMSDQVGSLEPGKIADVLLLNGDLHVERVFLGGEEYTFNHSA
jgi:N-acetylglucosamine-6-phosphate deacetylase